MPQSCISNRNRRRRSRHTVLEISVGLEGVMVPIWNNGNQQALTLRLAGHLTDKSGNCYVIDNLSTGILCGIFVTMLRYILQSHQYSFLPLQVTFLIKQDFLEAAKTKITSWINKWTFSQRTHWIYSRHACSHFGLSQCSKERMPLVFCLIKGILWVQK